MGRARSNRRWRGRIAALATAAGAGAVTAGGGAIASPGTAAPTPTASATSTPAPTRSPATTPTPAPTRSPATTPTAAPPSPAPTAHRNTPRAATASVTFAGRGHAIPRGFFGLTAEYNELPTYERLGPAFDHVIALIRPADGTPMSLRIGGKSADHALWQPAPVPGQPKATQFASPLGPKARGVFAIDPTWVANLAALVGREHLSVTLDVNLAVHSPTLETSFAAAVQSVLPRGALTALEIGNEPDEYHYQPPLERERVASTPPDTPPHWWSRYSAASYRRDYVNYARAFGAGLPGVPIGAPDITSNNAGWLGAVTTLSRLNPSFLAIHRYASSTCWSRSSPSYPTIPLLLGDKVSGGLAGSIDSAVAFAHAHRMALRLSEVNSVSCGKDAGIADTFATALWAPDALFEMIDAGVSSVNWEIRPTNPNAPFHISGGALVPLPELYGLALFARMTHRAGTLYSGAATGSKGLNLKAWAVRVGRAENVLLINKSPRAVMASVTAEGRRASVRVLTAPGVQATSGVTFAGAQIGPDGLWQGRQTVATLTARAGRYRTTVPGYSAALITPDS